MKSEQELSRVWDLYSGTIKRLAMVYLKNPQDTEDVFQNVFLKFSLLDKDFETPEHEKAWFVRVTVNQCKDFLKNFFRSKTVPLDILEDIPALSREKTDVLKTVLSLPEKYREVIYLFYYEDYQAKKIGKILGKNTNTIFTLLKRGRDILKRKLEEL